MFIPRCIYWGFKRSLFRRAPSGDTVLGAAVLPGMRSHPLGVLRRVVDWSWSPHEGRGVPLGGTCVAQNLGAAGARCQEEVAGQCSPRPEDHSGAG